jgi:hypothetical protein
MTDRQFREQEVQIARYQLLSREVTDPLAACLLRVIVEELEADLRRDRDFNRNCLEWDLEARKALTAEHWRRTWWLRIVATAAEFSPRQLQIASRWDRTGRMTALSALSISRSLARRRLGRQAPLVSGRAPNLKRVLLPNRRGFSCDYSRSRFDLCRTAPGAISAHIQTYVNPNPKISQSTALPLLQISKI